MGGAPLHSTSGHTSSAAGGEDERGSEARHGTAQLAPAALQGAGARERLVRGLLMGWGGEIYTYTTP